jgi:hypothetical protein
MKPFALALLSAPLFAAVTLACSLKIDTPDDGIVIQGATQAKPAKPAPSASASTSASTPTAPAPTAPTRQEPPTVTPATCASLAANRTPDGTFTVKAGKLTAKDVYIREYADTIEPPPGSSGQKKFYRTLAISFSDILHQCSYLNGLGSHDMGESRVDVSVTSLSATPPEIGVGTWGTGPDQSVSQEWEGGALCLTDAERKDMAAKNNGSVGFSGTAIGGNAATGKVTITKRTSTWVEGEADVTDPNGVRLVVAFAGPLCPTVPPPSSADAHVCCDSVP